MRKPLAVILSLLLATTGVTGIAMGVMSGSLSNKYRDLATYVLGGCFLLLLFLAMVFPLIAEKDYRRVLRFALFALAVGMLLIYIFFGFMKMVVSPYAFGVLLKIFPTLYGMALLFVGFMNYLLAQKAHRVYMFSVFAEVPHLYYRYRT